MNKVILVIDDPMYCLNCPLARMRPSGNGYVCGIGHPGIKEHPFGWTYEAVDMESKTKPYWCPLKTVPRKQAEGGTWTADGYIEDGFPIGWNACIEEILNE